MALFLVQHGRSLPKDQDPDQGLSEGGAAKVRRIAGIAAEHEVRVSGIQHSGKKRARQTAEIFASALDPPSGVHERPGLKPLDDVALISEALKGKDNIMLVGHLPFMERLTSYLITGDAERRVFRFQSGGLLCMDQDPESLSWFIAWALMPHMR